MKKRILSLGIIVFTSLAASAQITILPADFPVAGEFIEQGRDTLVDPSITEGAAGANQTYDFSQLQTWTFDTLNFEDPANLPAGDTFPNAFIALSQFGGYGFVEDNNGKIEIVGFAGEFMGLGADMVVEFSDPQTVINIPANYTDAFTDTSLIDVWLSNDPPIFPSPVPGLTIDSIRFKRVTTINSEIDGYGSVTGPTGTYDCLRQYSNELSIDSIWIKTNFTGWGLAPSFGDFGNPNVDTTLRYNYITKEIGYNFASVVKNGQGEIEFATFVSTPDSCCASVGEYEFSSNISVYPNPTKGLINIQTDDFSVLNFELYDITGKEVLNQSTQGISQLDLNAFENGIYLFRILSTDGELLRAGKINLSR